jgi:hypothetical protein
MGLKRSASLEEVLAHLEKTPKEVVLFIDQTKGCKDYAAFPWVQAASEVVEVDQEILDHFQIGKVPQFRFYIRGNEVAHLIGTASNSEFMTLRNKMLGTRSP